MKRAVAIRVYGDPEFGDVLRSAVTPTLNDDEMAIVKAELEKMRKENAELGVRKVRDRKDFSRKMRKLRRKGYPQPSCKAAQYALLAWAFTWLTIKACYEHLAAINRG